MPRRLESLRQPLRQRDVANSSTLRRSDVTFPFGACDRQLAIAQIDVTPFERHDLATAQPCFTAEQHDQVRSRAVGLRSLHEFLEVREVVKRCY